MITKLEQTATSGWLVLGVLAGAIMGDVIAVTLCIEPGYVRSVTSAPLLLTWRLSGAFVGLCISLAADRWGKKSPRTIFWVTCLCFFVVDLLIRMKYENMARE